MDEEVETHSIRITSQGKIKNWVAFALKSFDENPDLPLTFHTLSPEVAEGSKDAKKLASCTTLTPRLVSVVEIVKREYMKELAAKRSPRRMGLHQYNEIGMLQRETSPGKGKGKEREVEGAADVEEERRERIVEALSGKNHVRQIQTPYMRVTLSTAELPHLIAAGATYQPPESRKLSKTAKSRAAKRRRKEQEAQGKEGDEDAADPKASLEDEEMAVEP